MQQISIKFFFFLIMTKNNLSDCIRFKCTLKFLIQLSIEAIRLETKDINFLKGFNNIND